MFLTRLKETIHKHQLFHQGERILIGVSGGVDSIVLLDALFELAPEEGWQLFVAHLDHQFRGEESKEDARFVQEFCEQRQIPCEIGERNVPAFIEETRTNPQEASRILRFSFFHEVARKWNIHKLALAHHANDQAETVLMRVFRGTGVEGLAGIPSIRGENDLTIVRPLLGFFKKDLEQYRKERDLDTRLDSSNVKTKYKRNLLRLSVIPWIEEQLGHGIQDSLIHLADIASAENDFIEGITKEKLKEIIKSRKDNKIVIKGKLFLKYHVALQRRMIKLIFNYLLQKDQNLGFIHIDQVCEWIQYGRTGTCRDLPQGLQAWREYDDIVFSTNDAKNSFEEYCHSLAIPGSTYIGEIGLWVSATLNDRVDVAQDPAHTAIFDYDQIHGKIRIRSRRSGDRMTMLGMQGSKKVKDILIDAKIPRRLRETLPIVEDEENILWIPGVKRSNRAIKTSNTKQLLAINIEQLVDK